MTMSTQTANVERVLDVAEDEQQQYLEASYRDYLMIWRGLQRGLERARRNGDRYQEARFRDELSQLWPRPEAVARVAGMMKLAA